MVIDKTARLNSRTRAKISLKRYPKSFKVARSTSLYNKAELKLAKKIKIFPLKHPLLSQRMVV